MSGQNWSCAASSRITSRQLWSCTFLAQKTEGFFLISPVATSVVGNECYTCVG